MKKLVGCGFVGLIIAFTAIGKELKRPEKSQTLEGLGESVAAIHLSDENVWYLGDDLPEVYVAVFKKENGKFSFPPAYKSRRIKLDDKKIKDVAWSGFGYHDGQFILIDGFMLDIYYLDKEVKFYRKTQIAWDLIKPPADRIGEPPKFEVDKLRKKFSLHMKTAPGKRIRGIAKKSETENEIEYFVSTSLKDFPLVTMRCNKEDLALCKFERNCRSDSFKNISAVNRGGVAFDEKTNKVFMLDRGKNEVKVAKFESCLNLRHIDTLSFDKKMKPIDTIAYGHDRLWVGLSVKDDYYNNTIFTYDVN